MGLPEDDPADETYLLDQAYEEIARLKAEKAELLKICRDELQATRIALYRLREACVPVLRTIEIRANYSASPYVRESYRRNAEALRRAMDEADRVGHDSGAIDHA